MKKLFAVISIALVTSVCASAQEAVFGAQGGFGSNWLINNNVSDQAANLDQVSSFGPMFGIHAGYLFATKTEAKVGVIVEGNYLMVNQKYTGKDSLLGVMSSYEFTDKLAYIQVPVLFHVTGKSFFFEAGPQFSFLSSAKEDFTSSPAIVLRPDYSGREVKSGFENMVTSVAFGVGGHFNVAPNLFVDARLRFAYGLTDATVDYGSTVARDLAALEFFLGGDYGGAAGYYANTAQKGEYIYEKTSLATGHLLVGLSYRIPTGKK